MLLRCAVLTGVWKSIRFVHCSMRELRYCRCIWAELEPFDHKCKLVLWLLSNSREHHSNTQRKLPIKDPESGLNTGDCEIDCTIIPLKLLFTPLDWRGFHHGHSWGHYGAGRVQWRTVCPCSCSWSGKVSHIAHLYWAFGYQMHIRMRCSH